MHLCLITISYLRLQVLSLASCQFQYVQYAWSARFLVLPEPLAPPLPIPRLTQLHASLCELLPPSPSAPTWVPLVCVVLVFGRCPRFTYSTTRSINCGSCSIAQPVWSPRTSSGFSSCLKNFERFTPSSLPDIEFWTAEALSWSFTQSIIS